MSYPKWIYSKSGEAKIVKDEAEHKEHKDWAESPADFEVAEKYVEHMEAWPEKPAKKSASKGKKTAPESKEG
jgi:hypothetical protein